MLEKGHILEKVVCETRSRMQKSKVYSQSKERKAQLLNHGSRCTNTIDDPNNLTSHKAIKVTHPAYASYLKELRPYTYTDIPKGDR
jgi:hypothetical protein